MDLLDTFLLDMQITIIMIYTTTMAIMAIGIVEERANQTSINYVTKNQATKIEEFKIKINSFIRYIFDTNNWNNANDFLSC